MDIIIGFSRAKSPWKIGSKIIAEAEKRDYSHAYVKIINPFTKITLVYQASLGMVNMYNYNLFLEHNTVVEEYTMTATQENYKEILTFLHSNVGKPYSKTQVMFLSIKKLLGFEVKYQNKDEEFICSELAVRVIEIVIPGTTYDTSIDYVTPSDLNRLVNQLNLPKVEAV